MWLPPVLLLATGVGLLPLAGYFAFKSIRLLAAGESAPATVTKVTSERGSDIHRTSQTRYTVTIAFRAGNTPVTIERGWSVDIGASSFCLGGCYRRGDSLKVLYLPADPADARVDSVADLFLLPVLLLLFGALFAFLGGFVLRHFRQRPAFDVTPSWRA